MQKDNKLGAAVFGTGRVGREIIKGCHLSNQVDLVAGIVTNPEKDGVDLGQLVGVDELGVTASTDRDAVLGRDDIDVVFYAGLGDPETVASTLGQIAEAGKDAITLTGLVHPRAALGEEAARALHEKAVGGNARIVGAGWNPGFLLDVLPLTWAVGCARLDRVFAIRIAEMRDWGEGVHDECGIGFAVEDVTDTISNPLDESVALLADALGIDLERIDNRHEPHPSSSRREHHGRVVEAGKNAGFHKWATGVSDGKPVIELEMMAIFCIDEAEDHVSEGARVSVEGDSSMRAEATGGDWYGDSYPVTAGRAINTARPLRVLPPGLYRPDQVPLSR